MGSVAPAARRSRVVRELEVLAALQRASDVLDALYERAVVQVPVLVLPGSAAGQAVSADKGPSLTEPGQRHCATCTCPAIRIHLTVFPPNEVLYGTCEACGQPRWEVQFWDYHRRGAGYPGERTQHCGCCTHEHRPPGGYDLARRERVLA
jgi:hypothetical protein